MLLPASRAIILGPPSGWSDEKLKVPGFACLPARRPRSGVPFAVSLLLHAACVAGGPLLTRALPQERSTVVRVRIIPPSLAALMLRMPDRLYLPVRHMPTAGTHSASVPRAAARERGDQSGRQPAAQASAAHVLRIPVIRQEEMKPILIQPGRPIVADPRALHLPSLLYLSNSKLPPPPPEPVAPGHKAPPEPAQDRPAGATQNAATPARPNPLATGNNPLILPALPSPSAWSLVLQGGGGPSQEGKQENGEDISVLAIATDVPQPGQIVTVPPVNQPAAAARSTGSEPSSHAAEAGRAVSQGAAAAAPTAATSSPGSSSPGVASSKPSATAGHGNSAQGTAEHQGSGAGKSAAKSSQGSAQGQAGGNKSGSPLTGGASGPARVRVTPLGRVEIRDLPAGAQHWQFPAGGSFDIVIVQPSAGATIPDAERFLSGHPVQTVYISLETGKDWILQYCLPPSATASGQSGMVVTLGPEPKLDAPFIQQALVPPQPLLPHARPALFQAALDRDGRLARLRPVTDANYTSSAELLPYLEQWRFRPAKLDGVPTEVDVLLFVPASASR